MNKALRPKQFAAFFDNYKAAVLTVTALIISVFSFAQSIYYLKPTAPGYEYSRLRVPISLGIPKDTLHLLPEDSGCIAVKKNAIWLWTGYKWYSYDTAYIYSVLNTKISVVNRDNTLIGNGAGTPLGADTVNYIATIKRLRDSITAMRTLNASNWKLGGNSFNANGGIGTNDNFPFIHYQNGVERARFAATTGRYLVNTTTDNGTDQVQVNGSILASNFRSIASGLGQVSNTNWFTQRTEGGQTWSLALGTNLDLSNARYATVIATNVGYLIITAPNIQLNGEVTTTTAYLLSNTSTDFYKKNNTPTVFRQKPISGNRVQGWQFYSEATATNRPNPLTDPIFQIDAEGRTQIGDGTFNYGAALNVQSKYGAFLPPRLTTAQRDSISGLIDIVMTNPGTGYTSTPTVTITGGGGSGATGVAILSGGGILGVTIISKGIGYTSAPTVTFSGGGSPTTVATAVAHQGTLEPGMEIYNITTNRHQGWNGTTWNDFY